jgi:hypothetical protein
MSAIAIPDPLGRFLSTTLTFEDIATLDAQELGSENNPYAVIGLTISNALVKAAANLKSSSRGVALESKRSVPVTNQKQIDLHFAKPQGGFGFFYRVPRSSSLTVEALDNNGTILERDLFQAEEGYAGIIRAWAEIGIVRIIAKVDPLDIAENGCLYIDDLTFGRELKAGY